MPDSGPPSTAPTSKSYFSVTLLLLPVLASIALYQLDSFDPAPVPPNALAAAPLAAPLLNDRMLSGAEFVGAGRLDKPEDIAYHRESSLIYTGCADGWVKRVRVNESVAADSVVEDWVNTGGRPLGIAFGLHGEIIVADADKGLLNISKDGSRVEVLTDEAEGVKFKLTDAVDIAEDGVMYFSDASYKYWLKDYIFDVLEGKPHGRLLSYDPSTKTTQVLLKGLHFANGVVVSPDQDYVIVCETPLRRCSKYHIRGENIGYVETFVEGLPGYPDNIRYDGQGHYWIAFISAITTPWDLSMKYPFLRKIMAIAAKYGLNLHYEKTSGVFQVDLDGKPIAHYSDPALALISSGVKIGNHLYCGTILYPHITRLNLDQYPAHPAA